MIYVIIGTVLGLILNVHMWESIIGKIFGALSGMFIGFFIGALVWISIGSIIGIFLPTHYIVRETTNIVAFEDNSEVNGSFFLGCGKVNENTVYRYIIDTDNGKRVKELEENRDTAIYIKECSDSPKIEYKVLDFINQNNYWFACPFLSKEIITFHIPEGSVTNEFNVDLE